MLSLYIQHKRHGDEFELKNIEVTIMPSQITLLLGHNGAGKTTIIKSLFGLMDYVGTLSVNNKKIDLNVSEDVDYLKKNVSYISDEIALFDYLTPKEYFSLIENSFKHQVDHQLLEKLIKIFELERYLHIPISNLSHGNKKKTQIVSQLFKGSEFVIFDEPTNGLDPDMVIILRKTLHFLKTKGIGILLSTHHLSFGEELYDKVILLRNGKVKLNCTRDQVFEQFGRMSLEEIYEEANKDYYLKAEEILNAPDVRDNSEDRDSKTG
ncbi:ABC transporter ATP-binding protein [Aeribacillus sp. FSL M8-0235]|uniref:ABC transporter ATP-binding protein n=1 Tax=Aeribacillus sp. FSL M8-0235 TaxID=2954576 RepID=UPI0030F751EE